MANETVEKDHQPSHHQTEETSQPEALSAQTFSLSPQRKKLLLVSSLLFLVALPIFMVAVINQTRVDSRASNYRTPASPIITIPPIPKVTCVARPKCLDAKPPCKVPEANYCPPITTDKSTCNPACKTGSTCQAGKCLLITPSPKR